MDRPLCGLDAVGVAGALPPPVGLGMQPGAGGGKRKQGALLCPPSWYQPHCQQHCLFPAACKSLSKLLALGSTIAASIEGVTMWGPWPVGLGCGLCSLLCHSECWSSSAVLEGLYGMWLPLLPLPSHSKFGGCAPHA